MFFNQKVDATRGNLTRLLWRIAWPLMVVNLIHLIYNFTDTFWVSRLSESNQAISAVGISFQVVYIMTALAGGISVSITTLVSQFFGARDHDNLQKTCYTAFSLLGFFALAVTVLGVTLRDPLLGVLQTPPDILPYARQYFTINICGTFFMFLFYTITSILRGVGDTITGMVAGTVSGLINMVLDPFLIFGWGPFPRLGVAGAAWATIFSQAMVCLYLAWFVFSGRAHMKLSLSKIRFNRAIALRMIKIGVPAGLSQVVISISTSALLGRVNTFGTVATTAYTLGNRLDSLFFLPTMSMGQSVATLVGQNLGAGRPDRAKRSGQITIWQTFALLLILGISIAIYPEFFFRTLFNADSDVMAIARYYALYMSLGYAFISVRMVVNGVLQGAAATTRLLVTTTLCLALRVGLAYAGSYTSLGLRGLFLGMALSYVLSSFFMYGVFLRGKWIKTIDLIKNKADASSREDNENPSETKKIREPLT